MNLLYRRLIFELSIDSHRGKSIHLLFVIQVRLATTTFCGHIGRTRLMATLLLDHITASCSFADGLLPSHLAIRRFIDHDVRYRWRLDSHERSPQQPVSLRIREHLALAHRLRTTRMILNVVLHMLYIGDLKMVLIVSAHNVICSRILF